MTDRRNAEAGIRLRRAAACTVTAVLLSAILAGAAAPPDGAGTPSSLPEQVLTELRAAHAARAQLAKDRDAWAMEKERLELLASAVRGEAERHRAIAEKTRREEADLASRVQRLQADRQRLEQVEAMIDSLAERIEKALADLATASLPGTVPRDAATGITDPAQRLAAAAGRLAEARLRARRSSVELVVGHFGKQEVTVRLLRAGAVAAWWMTLDGSQAGAAAVEDGRLVLRRSETPDEATAVRKAFAIADGHAPPDWILLPVQANEAP